MKKQSLGRLLRDLTATDTCGACIPQSTKYLTLSIYGNETIAIPGTAESKTLQGVHI